MECLGYVPLPFVPPYFCKKLISAMRSLGSDADFYDELGMADG